MRKSLTWTFQVNTYISKEIDTKYSKLRTITELKTKEKRITEVTVFNNGLELQPKYKIYII